MTPNELIDILKVAGNLRTNTRHNWTAEGRRESVADHSWRAGVMAMLLTGVPEFKDLDMNKVIKLCLIHDIGEAITGDIPSFLKTVDDTIREDDALHRWIETFPSPQREEWMALLEEKDAKQTPEAKLYKAIDKLEANIAHNEDDIEHWLPLEYELQYTYADGTTEHSPYLTELRKAVDAWTTQKIEEKKHGESHEEA